ncbi:MAG: exonuclease domain-containing protein [Terracidiphilus sp.]|jgi:DNA polymerase-3 subunit epsilon
MTAPGAVDYFVVDVETANQARNSICQIGIAFFAGGRMVDGWESLVNPHDEFLAFNVALHGIGPRTVAQAPSWSELFPKVRSMLSGAAVASHTEFDRSALSGACLRAGIPAVPYSKWIDTCWLARCAWPHLPNHKLPTLARTFRIAYRAHDALEDARVAGEVLALALQERRMTIHELLASPANHITAFPRLATGQSAATPRATGRLATGDRRRN